MLNVFFVYLIKMFSKIPWPVCDQLIFWKNTDSEHSADDAGIVRLAACQYCFQLIIGTQSAALVEKLDWIAISPDDNVEYKI